MKNSRTRDGVSGFSLLQMSLCIAALGWLPADAGAQAAPSYFDANGLKDGSDNAKAAGVDAVAAGNTSVASGALATALGSGTQAVDQNTTAVGAYAAAVKANASAVGANSFAGEAGSTAVGANANAFSVNATVVGESALVNGKNSTALGRLSRASTDNSVALGANSVADRANTVSVGSVQSVTDSDGNVTAPFQRQIINVAAGTQDNDATNLAQYRGLVTALGGNASVNAAGALTAPSYVIQGVSSAKVGDAFSAVDIWMTGMRSSLTSLDTRVVGIDARAAKLEQTAVTATSATTASASNSAQYGNGGTALVLNANNGAGTVINNVAAGVAATDAANVGQLTEMQKALVSLFNSGACKIGAGGSVACGNGVSAKGANAIAQGTNASANGDNTVALGAGATASFNGSVAIGAGAQAIADPATAIGNNAIASGNNSVAVGANAVASASNSVALGQGSVATRANTVSVGYAGGERQIANVAPGTAGTDAVNLNQMQASAQDTLNQSKSYAARATAQAMAIPHVYIARGDSSGVALGTASYGGYGALGIAFASSISQHTQLAFGASAANGGQVAIQGSGSFSW
ncbi:YadA family autotransporter adhesin [Collimonas humicola]|uniref:YadA family autotransporter adhesin n=1 Tax=Collimonas humicola TaxID=2825886 RepID=UPI001B8AB7A4|nr:adhesin [Collimonas humicola]